MIFEVDIYCVGILFTGRLAWSGGGAGDGGAMGLLSSTVGELSCAVVGIDVATLCIEQMLAMGNSIYRLALNADFYQMWIQIYRSCSMNGQRSSFEETSCPACP